MKSKVGTERRDVCVAFMAELVIGAKQCEGLFASHKGIAF